VWLGHCARHVEHEWWIPAAKVRKCMDDVETVPPGEGAWVNEAAVACDWPPHSGDAL
jgi:hypothetical protein